MFRDQFISQIELQMQIHPVCAILGPRQVGKTTLAGKFAQAWQHGVTAFDLEDSRDLLRLEDPFLALEPLANNGKLIIIDEIQLRPNLFPVLRVLVDKYPVSKFLILGSASRDLIRQSSETLAGRIGYIELTPFALTEVGEMNKLWLQGGFPRSFLAVSELASFEWRQSYIQTFLERDIPALGFAIPATQLRRFWLMLCHYHGQVFNASELGRSMALSDHTVRKYLDILAGTFMIRQLQPWFANINKRQVRAPKIYFRDSGILHALLGIKQTEDMWYHAKLGALWEGFALEEVVRKYKATPEQCYFWATHSGAELDLLLVKDGKMIGFEFKYADAPKITPSMRSALTDLELDHLYIVHPGQDFFPMAEKISLLGLKSQEFLGV